MKTYTLRFVRELPGLGAEYEETTVRCFAHSIPHVAAAVARVGFVFESSWEVGQ